MSLVFIKHLGIAIPSDYIQSFAIHMESRISYELAKSDLGNADLQVKKSAMLTCGVTITLPADLLASDDAATLNARFEKEAEQAAAPVVVEEEKPKRGRRGRKAKVVEEPEEDEDEVDEGDDEIVPDVFLKAVFIPVLKHQIELEIVPLLQSNSLDNFSEAHQTIIEGKVAQFMALRNKVEETRSKLRTPSSNDIEASIHGFGDIADTEGLNRYEDSLRAIAEKHEASLRGLTEWFDTKFIAKANEKTPVKISLFNQKAMSFGKVVIELEDVLKEIRKEFSLTIDIGVKE